MDVKRWILENKKQASLLALLGYVLLRIGGWVMIWQFILVGAIPGTTYSLPPGVMLMLFGAIVWMIFCQRSAVFYWKKFNISRQLQPIATTLRTPRRRFSKI